MKSGLLLVGLVLFSGCTEYAELDPTDTVTPKGTGRAGPPDVSRGWENVTQPYQWSSNLRSQCPSCGGQEASTEYRPDGALSRVSLRTEWSSPFVGVQHQLVATAELKNATSTRELARSSGFSPLTLNAGLDPNATVNHTLVLRVRFASTPYMDQPFQVSGSLNLLRPRDA